MVREDIIHRAGTFRRSTFTINYFHSKVTPEIRERASKEDKERIQRTLDILAKKDGSYINENGCIVTKKIENKEQNKQPRSIKVETKEEKPTPIQVKKFSSEAPEEKPAVLVKKSKDGVSISITLNINLNN